MPKWIKYLAAALAAGMVLLAGGCGQQEKTIYTASGGQASAETEAQSQGAAAGAVSGTALSDGREAPITEHSGEEADGQLSAQNSVLGDPGTEAEAAPPLLYVYVCGAVQTPGVYGLEEGSRVYEAIALAGGFTEGADEEWLNQAELVADGQKLQVYTRQETREWREQGLSAQSGEAQAEDSTAWPGSSVEGTDGDGKVNLNTASKEELMTLSGIGETKAEAILSYRQEHGAFSSIEEIQKIPGIKSAVFSKIKDRITV